MQIIDTDLNKALAEASHRPLVGFATGLARIICGIVQIIFNAIGALFSFIPTILGCCDQSSFHAVNLARDCGVGILHVGRGFFEFLPGTSFCINMTSYGSFYEMTTDNPASLLNSETSRV